MAGRHFFPLLSESDIGPDADKVLPIFPALEPIKYKAGMDADTLVKQFKGKDRVALEAPPCSRKSVDVPAALLRGGLRKLVVHCVPSRLLAASTHRYVKGLHTDVVVRLVTDFDGPDSFPRDGLVHTSTGILAAYMSAWRAAGIEQDYVLFLDEMHESDFATATLRSFQTAAWGVSIYIEATATRGTGAGGTFARSTLPGGVSDYRFQRQHPSEWNLFERGKPWSLLKTNGDFLIFEDDPDDARLICDKFGDQGVRAFRLTSKTSVEDFERTMAQVNNPQQGEGIAVLVVDYSFRSGFTFPTVARIIDQGEVRYLQMERGRSVFYKRNAYMSEVYQARNRGGRVEGRPCDCWVADYTAEPVRVSYEGVEVDLACILFRMLGRRPNGPLSHSPFVSGNVPRQFNHILCGEQPLRAYKCDAGWPGEDRAPQTPPMVSPIEANFPITPDSRECVEDDASIFTVGDDASSIAGSMSEEQFAKARQQRSSHVRERPKPRLEDAPPVPRLDARTADDFNDAFTKLATGGVNKPRMEFGHYYYANGLSIGDCVVYHSFEDVLSDIGELSSAAYMRSIRGSTLHDACAQALAAYNNAVVIATAANYVVRYASQSDVIRGSAEPGALQDWAKAVRTEFVRANSRAQHAMELLLATSKYKYMELGGMQAKEQHAAEEFLNMLSLGMRDGDVEETYRNALPSTGFNPSGRYQLDIRPSGWRTKLALACLGNKPGYIDMAVAPDQQDGGTVPVYTSASQLAVANRGKHYV